MSYRNDHDAALARVDALQREVAQLRIDAAKNMIFDAAYQRVDELEHEVAQLKAKAAMGIVALPRPPIRPGAGLLRAVSITATALCIGAGIAMAAAPPAADDAQAVAALDVRVNQLALGACVDAIQPLPPQLSSPRLSAQDIAAVEATGAPCRLQLRQFVAAGLWSPAERDALENWALAEDQLANTIAMIGVYHGDDPMSLDGGATSAQLWSEYARAHSRRNEAISLWRATR
jgi:hypothetical protein